MLKIQYDKCTGCGACLQACPKQCIQWEEKEFGFRYPVIDEEKCIECGLCIKRCPIGIPLDAPTHQQAYAVVHEDKEVILKSTSGGAFTAIAEYVFSESGVVYGVTMNDNFQVQHIRIDSLDEINRLRGSKYVQSDTNDTYIQAEEDIKSGKLVLYTGTPCQIAGLKAFLGKDYENLITADIVCHGVGSQAYFDKYLDFARRKYGDIKELRFRDKEFVGWSVGGSVTTQNRIKPYREYENYYYAYFLKGEIYRMSCYTCRYASLNRPGDFTIGDFWGIEALSISINAENGCSLLLLNSKKGKHALKQLAGIEMYETTLEQATCCNTQLRKPTELTQKRESLSKEYNDLSANEIQKKYVSSYKKYIVRGRIKSLVPYRLKRAIRSKMKHS